MKENDILKNLRETYLLAAADLELFPEGSEEYRRAEVEAMNTSRTVFELYGATAAEDLRAAGLQERSRVAERMRRGHAATNFEKITASPEALAAFLSSLPVLSGPWDEALIMGQARGAGHRKPDNVQAGRTALILRRKIFQRGTANDAI